jgi:DinB superfamily
MEDLTPILLQLESTRAALFGVAEPLPENHWTEAPKPGAWSAGEVFAHLAMVESRVVAQSELLMAAPPVTVPFWRCIHLPVSLAEWRGFRVKSPIPLDRGLVAAKQDSFNRLATIRNRTVQLIEENRRRELRLYRFPHPLFGNLNIYDWFRLLAFHEARHTKQLQEIGEIFQR